MTGDKCHGDELPNPLDDMKALDDNMLEEVPQEPDTPILTQLADNLKVESDASSVTITDGATF